MTYQLYLGNRLYFSWSLAAYLTFHRFSLGDQIKITYLRPETEDGVGALMAPLAPARTLPTVVAPDGTLLSDSMAIAEEIATRHPEAGHWPTDPLARGTARSLANEMHSSFKSLRGDWPVNLRQSYADAVPTPAVNAELDRLEQIWTHARSVTKSETPWLCGDYSLADAIFAPMATRLATYGFDTRPTTAAYVAAHLADPAVRRWRAMGLANEPVLPGFERLLTPRPWPGPTPIAAHAVDRGPSINATCPYSGDPVTHFMEVEGKVIGYCNAFCRDKSMMDPEAWPGTMALLRG